MGSGLAITHFVTATFFIAIKLKLFTVTNCVIARPDPIKPLRYLALMLLLRKSGIPLHRLILHAHTQHYTPSGQWRSARDKRSMIECLLIR